MVSSVTSGKLLILDVKGQDTHQDATKREFLAEWIRSVNQHGGFGEWSADVSRNPRDLLNVLQPTISDPRNSRSYGSYTHVDLVDGET